MTELQFRDALKSRCEQFGSLRKYAKHLGVTPSFVSAVAVGKKRPSNKILQDMGLTMRQITVFEQRNK